MAWHQKALASVAGMASGSVMTWMVMDNKVINEKRRLETLQTTLPTMPTEPTMADKKLFFGVATVTTAGLALIRLLGER